MDDGSRALPQKVDAATQQGPILRGGGRFSDTGFSIKSWPKWVRVLPITGNKHLTPFYLT